MYSPMKPRKTPTPNRTYGISRRADQSTRGLLLISITRGRMTKSGIMSVPRDMKARIRVAHPNPMLGWRLVNAIGRTIPAMLEPVVAIPVAADFLVVKYVAITATEGMKRQPAPMPTQKPWASRTW